MAEIKKDFARGNRISEKRKKLGMSQDEMAERIGICRQALSAIENGGAFKTQTLEKLVSVLGLQAQYQHFLHPAQYAQPHQPSAQ